ncbi:MAG: hypothetical protein K0U74_12555 [Alphaproteobacteria bacterium]|nr:hypothetical protein [Alphaproteobacteria bacterium]
MHLDPQTVTPPETPEEGLAIARRRIAECIETGDETLDLGGLQLTEIPAEAVLAARAGRLAHVKRLYLGGDAAVRAPDWDKVLEERDEFRDPMGDRFLETPQSLVLFDKKRWNALGALPDALFETLSALVELDLAQNRLTVLPGSIAGVTSLTSLNLGGNGLGADGARHLAGLTRLTSLNLESNRLGADGARHLAALTSLTSLNLRGNDLGAAGARHLAALAGLTSLNLWGNGLGDAGARHLAALTSLTSLNLWGNRLGDAGARHLAALAGLTSLDLGGNNLGDAGARHLAALTSLTRLNLADNDLGDISPLLSLDRLADITLSENEIVDACPEFWLKPSLRRAVLDDTTLGDVPKELLSQYIGENCLPRLQAHFRDLGYKASGPRSVGFQEAPVPDIKVLVLGNGRIGKTQICRRLRGEPFVENDCSTHGVVVRATRLPLASPANADAMVKSPASGQSPVPQPQVPLHLWDFGGQDLYLGTHALFLKTRAIFPIVWTPRTESGVHDDGHGHVSENYPVEYWVRYVRQMAGAEHPLILTQSQWPQDRRRAPNVPADLLNSFDHHDRVTYSPKTDPWPRPNRQRTALDNALQDAVEFVHRDGVPKIGGGRAWVKDRLEQQREQAIAARKAGKADPAAAMISRDAFDAKCRDPECISAGGVSDPGELLRFLHDIGTVFAFERRGDDRIIVDLEWALSAIYAVFERGSGVYKHIKEVRGGRFTREELGQFLWNDLGHGLDEQDVFVDMMLKARIAFRLVEPRQSEAAQVFVAPDLLPPRENVQDRLDQVWDDTQAYEPASFPYDLLPPGLIRSLMADIGAEAGVSAIYWKDGFYFYDAVTKTKAVITQERDGKAWSGRIVIRTTGGEEAALARALAELVKEHQDRLGVANDDGAYRFRRGYKRIIDNLSGETKLKAKRQAEVARSQALRRGEGEHERGESALRRSDGGRSIPQPAATPMAPDAVYISYAWGSSAPDAHPEDWRRELAADAACDFWERQGRTVLRDRNVMQFGDLITNFMEQIAGGQQIVLILSKKYLRSPYCMYELYRIYEKCRAKPDWAAELHKRVQVWRLPCAQISGTARFQHWGHWDEQRQLYEKQASRSLESLGEVGYKEYLLTKAYAAKVSDIVAILGDQLAPQIRDIDDDAEIAKLLEPVVV